MPYMHNLDPEALMQEWRRSPDKNSDRFWGNPKFREAYAATLEYYSSLYERTVGAHVQDCVSDLIELAAGDRRARDDCQPFDDLELHLKCRVRSLSRCIAWSSESGNGGHRGRGGRGLTVRILSLGCGPGIDLLAVARVLADWDGSVARIECVGVDLLSHPLGGLLNELEKIADQNPSLTISAKLFAGVDAHNFVDLCESIGLRFDLISARYINAIDKLALVRDSVPRLLSRAGRVLLLDNYSDTLAGLARRPGGYFEYRELRQYRPMRSRIFLVHRTVPQD